ncbi:hypothetical protein CDCA_CDCA02G0543 [Cyanidium caldarium]|uniref:CCT-theta n=1 Tax=Cyanidium caldarium TaxID=2771 RepID=A0AAV9IR66_CYACA|nr:hypothetical protein CDCA_CDCA02G0543 [Cyanidium caldarium]|eukprot:ctg_672.g374
MSTASFIRPGVSGLLREGAQHLYGLHEAVLKNVEACKMLAGIVRSSFGPDGCNKLISNRLGKLFITSDAATIVHELEVVHPAAKMVVMAAQAQEREAGDGTGLVMVLAGELLALAVALLHEGLHPSEIVTGYKRAAQEALQALDALECWRVEDVRDEAQVARALRASLASKQLGMEERLAALVAAACNYVLPSSFDGKTLDDMPLVELGDASVDADGAGDDGTGWRARVQRFNVDSVRVAKVLGGSLADSTVLRGAVLVRDVEGTVRQVRPARVAVYSGDLDTSPMETKGTVLLHSAQELQNYTKSEEALIAERVQKLAAAGVNVVVSGGKFGEVALHFLEQHRIMAIRCPSKFDLRRVARTTGAVAMVAFGDRPPTADEIGACDAVQVEEMGATKLVVLRQESDATRIATVVLRGSNENLLDDVERAIDDAVRTFKVVATRDARLVAGGGAAEMELARRLEQLADQTVGLEQHAMRQYAEALKVVPRTLAENAGRNPLEFVTRLYAAHVGGHTHAGLAVEADDEAAESAPPALAPGIVDAREAGVLDSLCVKYSALKLATDAAVTVLQVDALIMSKATAAAGGGGRAEGGA